MIEYPIVVFWSDEDEAFIADVPDIRYCSAHGETAEEAFREEGITPPPPTLHPVPKLRAAS